MVQTAWPVKAVACVIAAVLIIMVPVQHVGAAMIPTDQSTSAAENADLRLRLLSLVDRQDVREALIHQGIDPVEARLRIQSLTDAELSTLADRIDQLPAGGSTLGLIVGAVLIVFLVLLITDIAGYTNIFPFVKHTKR